MNLLELSLNELKQGYHEQNQQLHCNYCDCVFPLMQKESPELMAAHLKTLHGPNYLQLIQLDSKYNTLTEKQRALLVVFSSGAKDKAIATEMGVSPATIRHQRFTFREKAKQAKLYLATYEMCFDQTEVSLLAVPERAMDVDVDARFAITEEEYTATVKRYFDFSNDRLELRRWPKQQKVIITLLHRVIEEFQHNKHYTDKETTALLKDIYFDYVILRRYLIEYGFLDRTADGRTYWRCS